MHSVHPVRRHRRRPGRAIRIGFAFALIMVGVAAVTAFKGHDNQPVQAGDGSNLSVAEECRQALGYDARTAQDQAWLRACVHSLTPRTATPTPSGSTDPTGSPSSGPTTSPTTPSSTPTSPSAPSAPGFPDASNTGVPAGVALKTSVPSCVSVSSSTYWIVRSGNDGCVIDGYKVPGQIEVQSNNVTIRNSRVMCSPDNCINAYRVSGLTVSHVEIGPDSGFVNVNGARGINGGNNLTVEAVNIHNTVDGIWPGSNTVIADSFIHNLDITNDGAHSDGIQTSGGASSVVIRHNRIEGGNTSDMLVQKIDGLDNGWIIDGNLLMGIRAAAGVTSYAVGFDAQACPALNCRFTNNVLNRTWEVGTSYTPTNWTATSWSGNTFTDGTVAPVPR